MFAATNYSSLNKTIIFYPAKLHKILLRVLYHKKDFNYQRHIAAKAHFLLEVILASSKLNKTQ